MVDEVSEFRSAWDAGRLPSLAPRRFLDEDDRKADALPHSWSVTTDSIAARVAVRLGLEEIVLLKSASPPSGITLEEAAASGFVDPYFPTAALGLTRVVAVDLRSTPFNQSAWDLRDEP